VDLALVGRLESTALWKARDLLNEVMPTPYFYDVVHLDTLTDSEFKERILAEGKPIYQKGGVFEVPVQIKANPSLRDLESFISRHANSARQGTKTEEEAFYKFFEILEECKNEGI